MRVKKDRQTALTFSSSRGPKIVADFERKYNGISEVLDGSLEVLDLVHREVKRRFGRLIASVRRVEAIARQVQAAGPGSCNLELAGIAAELAEYLPAVRTIADVAERVAIRGETVPASERIFSLFEQHAELIKRGKRSKPVEFGHAHLAPAHVRPGRRPLRPQLPRPEAFAHLP